MRDLITHQLDKYIQNGKLVLAGSSRMPIATRHGSSPLEICFYHTASSMEISKLRRLLLQFGSNYQKREISGFQKKVTEKRFFALLNADLGLFGF
jgi:hypothetical protein